MTQSGIMLFISLMYVSTWNSPFLIENQKCHFYTVIGIMGPRFVCLKIICYNYSISQASLVPQMVTICLHWRRPSFDPWIGDSLGKRIAIHSSILAWRIPWPEQPGGLQSTGLQRVGRDWAPYSTNTIAQPTCYRMCHKQSNLDLRVMYRMVSPSPPIHMLKP